MSPLATVTVSRAAAQSADFPGTFGENVSKLAVWNGRVYAGYGDYNGTTNSPHGTGPIDVVSADVSDFASGFSSEATLHTQQTWVFRNGLSGRLWIPYIDPIRGPQGDITEARALEDGSLSYAYADEPDAWTIDQILLPYSIHGMDMVETPEALFVAGAQITTPNGGPGIWKSTDRGATWTEDFFLNSTDDFYRMYCFLDWGDGSLSAIASSDFTAPRCWHREVGGEWEEYTDPVLAIWGNQVLNQGPYGNVLIGFTGQISDSHLFSYQGTPVQLCTGFGKQNGRVDVGTGGVLVLGKPDTDPAVLAAAENALPPSGAFHARGDDISVSSDGQRAYIMLSLGGQYNVVHLFRLDTDLNWQEIATFDPQYGLQALAVDEDGGHFYTSRISTVSQFALP